MRKRRLTSSIFGILVLALFGIICVREASAATKDAEFVRVGYVECNNFIEKTNGEYSGYAVEYLNEIAKYTGWEYRYVSDNWENCVRMLRNGQIDIVCTGEPTYAVLEGVLYSDIPFGYEYTMVYTRNDTDIFYEDFEAMNGKKVGVVQGSIHADKFAKYAQENGFTYEPVYFDAITHLTIALESGKVDMIVIGSLYNYGSAKVVGRYDATPFYAMVGEGNEEVLAEFDAALNRIKIENRALEASLTEKYYGFSQMSSAPLYTREEHEFIMQADPVKVMLMVDKVPLSYIKDGKYCGIFVDYLELLEEKSGIDIEIEMTATPMNMQEQTYGVLDDNYLVLRSNRVIGDTEQDDRLIVTAPLIDNQLAYVRKRSDIATTGRMDYTFALTKEMVYFADLTRKVSKFFEYKYYETPGECLDAVLRGEADIAVQDSYVFSHLLQKPIYTDNLVEVPGEKCVNGMCLIASEGNEMLVQVFNKAINYITDEEKASIITLELLMNPYERTTEDHVYKYQKPIKYLIVIVAVSMISYTLLIRKISDLKVRRKEYNLMQRRLHRDELTGIYNRNYFYEKVKATLETATEPMCIVVMDIEKFRVINELYGMEAGDKVLCYMADMLTKLGEGRDFLVSRFTEDHFYICMKEKDLQEIHLPRHHKTFLKDIVIKVVYGVYIIGDQTDIPVNSMCDRASLAMHDKENKQGGYIYYYSDDERQRLLYEQEIENELERALKERQFRVFLQSKHDIYSGKVVGGEALIRWFHPEKGIISPGKFIGICEKNGFIIGLDYYIWEEACKVLSDFKRKGIELHPISVNVSRAHLYGTELKEKLESLIEKYDLSPEDLEIEITETIYADDIESINNRVKELKKSGFKIAMDDFGSGYSSLNMLKEMPLDIIKMDLKFLDAKDEDKEKSRNILGTLIKLAKSLGFAVVVEGVETKEQVEFLREVGQCSAQGYYFSKPISIMEYENMLS
ncbi:MAG: EAL domain-containing protein [Lachnospiraceae bacterium]|nr:EAL domain-containing protein [Lachnospiraceae bacterium]